MNRQIIDVLMCKDGDKLAEDVLNEKGMLLIGKSAIINCELKMKLFEAGIREIKVDQQSDQIIPCKIHDQFFEFEKAYHQNAKILKNILYRLSKGEKLDLNGVNRIYESIYSQFNNNNVIYYLDKLRDKDEYTYAHCINVGFYSMLIGKWMNLPDNKIKEITKSGILHDIGKIEVPDFILSKKGKLNTDEFEFIKRHPAVGYKMLGNLEMITEEVALGVLMHHERENGSGYPAGMAGENIHLYAKIIAVADVFDAITSNRVYQKKKTPFQAFEILRSLIFGLLDSKIVFTFLHNINRYYVGTKVMLNTGHIGEIIHISPRSVSKPIVRIGKNYLDLSTEENIDIESVI